MPQNLTNASGILKQFYLPRLREQLNDTMSPTYNALEKTGENVEGLEVVLSIHHNRNVGSGSRAEGGTLPTPGHQRTAKVTTDLFYHYIAVQFSGQVIRRAATDAGSFVRAAQLEMDRAEIDGKHMMNRQLFNDAEDSLIPTSGTPTGQVVPVANATDEQFRSVLEGMIVDIGTSGVQADGADSVVVESVDESAKTITFAAGSNVASVTNNMFIRQEDAYGNEQTGLRQIVASGDTLFGVSGATNRQWNSTVKSNSGTNRIPTELLLQTTIDTVAIKSGAIPNLAVAPHDVVRNYGAQLTSQKRYNDTVQLTGGFEGLSIATGSGTVTLVNDRFAPANKMFLLNTNHLAWNEAADWEWMQEDGSVLDRTGADAYRGDMFKYSELTTDRRNAHAVLEDLSGISA